MEQGLIERLRHYRAELAAHVAEPGFMALPDRNDTLARLLATDRLLATVTEAPKEAA